MILSDFSMNDDIKSEGNNQYNIAVILFQREFNSVIDSQYFYIMIYICNLKMIINISICFRLFLLFLVQRTGFCLSTQRFCHFVATLKKNQHTIHEENSCMTESSLQSLHVFFNYYDYISFKIIPVNSRLTHLQKSNMFLHILK